MAVRNRSRLPVDASWKRAVDRFVKALETSPTLRAYRNGHKAMPPKPHHGADPHWGRGEGMPDEGEESGEGDT